MFWMKSPFCSWHLVWPWSSSTPAWSGQHFNYENGGLLIGYWYYLFDHVLSGITCQNWDSESVYLTAKLVQFTEFYGGGPEPRRTRNQIVKWLGKWKSCFQTLVSNAWIRHVLPFFRDKTIQDLVNPMFHSWLPFIFHKESTNVHYIPIKNHHSFCFESLFLMVKSSCLLLKWPSLAVKSHHSCWFKWWWNPPFFMA